jgi:predicted phage terminase large subunit-like protein
MATRWHEDDLIGHLLEQDAEDGQATWTLLALPAIATYDEEFRKEGEALWPERFPLEELAKILRDITSYWFSAEYQCTPAPEDGLHFKRSGVRYWRRHPDGYMLLQANGSEVFMKDSRTWKFITVDLAASEKETADYTVVACWAVTPNTEMILVDIDRKRYSGPEKIPAIKKMLALHNAQYVAIEKSGFQLDFVKNARAAGLPCLELVAKGDKVERAIESTVKWESGMIYIPANASWTSAYEEELYVFNAGRHDDQVDVTAYAAIEVGKRGYASDYAYGLVECTRCHRKYTCTERTGLDRPCIHCGNPREIDVADSFAVPVE